MPVRHLDFRVLLLNVHAGSPAVQLLFKLHMVYTHLGAGGEVCRSQKNASRLLTSVVSSPDCGL